MRMYSSQWGSGFHVSVWMEGDSVTEMFNISDSTGCHSIKSAKFKRLSPEIKASIKSALGEARLECRKKMAAQMKSQEAISKVYRDDMIRYCETDPWGYADRTLAGTNYNPAKDCAEFETFQDLQDSRSIGGHAYDSRLSCYYGCLIEGGYVIDRHDVLDANPGLSIRSPMLDSTIRQVCRFKDVAAERDTSLLSVLADPACFGGIAMLAKAASVIDSIESFDYVPLSVHLAWWKSKGARVGRRVANTIVWEDGVTENIRPASDRWMVNGKIVDR